MPVRVFIVKTARGASNLELLEEVFSSAASEISIVECSDYERGIEEISDKCREDCVIVSDKMTTHASKKRVAEIIKRLISCDAEVGYLARHSDHCQKSRIRSAGRGYTIVRTEHAQGLNALYLSSLMLGKIRSEGISAISDSKFSVAVTPKLLDLDVRNVHNNEEFTNSQECAGVAPPLISEAPEAPTLGATQILVIFLAMLFIVIVAWALIYIGPRT